MSTITKSSQSPGPSRSCIALKVVALISAPPRAWCTSRAPMQARGRGSVVGLIGTVKPRSKGREAAAGRGDEGPGTHQLAKGTGQDGSGTHNRPHTAGGTQRPCMGAGRPAGRGGGPHAGAGAAGRAANDNGGGQWDGNGERDGTGAGAGTRAPAGRELEDGRKQEGLRLLWRGSTRQLPAAGGGASVMAPPARRLRAAGAGAGARRRISGGLAEQGVRAWCGGAGQGGHGGGRRVQVRFGPAAAGGSAGATACAGSGRAGRRQGERAPAEGQGRHPFMCHEGSGRRDAAELCRWLASRRAPEAQFCSGH
jgi:hypothetical protein